MKPFAFKKAAELSANLTEELSAAEMAAAKGAGGTVPSYIYRCFEMCDGTTCGEVCYWDHVDDL